MLVNARASSEFPKQHLGNDDSAGASVHQVPKQCLGNDDSAEAVKRASATARKMGSTMAQRSLAGVPTAEPGNR